MSEVVVIASLIARPGKEPEAQKFLSDLLATTHAEQGCMLYALHHGTDDPRHFVFVERWESRPLLDKHLASEHIQTALTRVGEHGGDLFTQALDVRYYDAIPGGETDKGSIAGHAAK